MNTVIAFIGGAFLSGVVLALVFGALPLNAEKKAYKKGISDAKVSKNNDLISKIKLLGLIKDLQEEHESVSISYDALWEILKHFPAEKENQ